MPLIVSGRLRSARLVLEPKETPPSHIPILASVALALALTIIALVREMRLRRVLNALLCGIDRGRFQPGDKNDFRSNDDPDCSPSPT
jgi:hypothetical protein